jgi:outer membrane protein assembly factor BamC
MTSNRLITTALLAALMVSSSGCSWLFGDDGMFRDRSHDYRKAKLEPPLQLPEHIDSEAIDDSYAIPTISDHSGLEGEFEVPRPEPLTEDVARDAVRINTLGDQRWILVDGAPGQVWPRLRGFLSLNQLAVQRIDAASGIIETNWLQPSGEGILRERYRFRIEQGVQRGSSEIYVLQADIRAGQEDWPATSNSVEREQLITQELAQYLADSSTASAVSMLAQQAIDSSGKVTLKEDDKGQPYIQLTLSFDRAWASVGKALDKADFRVDDLDRSQGLYYLHYAMRDANKKDKPGFFSSLFTWGDDADSKKNGRSVAYLLHVTEQSNNIVTIRIERQNHKAISREQVDTLLKLIKRNLS